MELGESLGDCARREVKEETGLEVELTGIVGIYSDPKHVFAYDDGEVRQEFSICFLAQDHRRRHRRQRRVARGRVLRARRDRTRCRWSTRSGCA